MPPTTAPGAVYERQSPRTGPLAEREGPPPPPGVGEYPRQQVPFVRGGQLLYDREGLALDALVARDPDQRAGVPYGRWGSGLDGVGRGRTRAGRVSSVRGIVPGAGGLGAGRA